MTSEARKDRAKKSLNYYFALAVSLEKGSKLHPDCKGEIDHIVDDIVEAAVEKIRESLAEEGRRA